MFKIKRYNDILGEYMPSFRAVSDFVNGGFTKLNPSQNVANSYKSGDQIKNLSQNMAQLNQSFGGEVNNFENIFKAKTLNRGVANTSESIYKTQEKVREKENYSQKSQNFTKLSEYRNHEKTNENSGKNIEVNFDMSGMQNTVNNKGDIDDFVQILTQKLESALSSSASGVHI